MHIRIFIAPLILSVSITAFSEEKKCDMSVIRSVKDVIACRGSLKLVSCAVTDVASVGAGITAGVAANKLTQKELDKRRFTPEERKLIEAKQKELVQLQPKVDKFHKNNRNIFKVLNQATNTEVQAATQNQVISDVLNKRRLYEGMDVERYDQLRREIAMIESEASYREKRVPTATVLKKFIAPGVGLVTGLGAAAAVGISVADYLATASPTACSMPGDNLKSLDKNCKDDFENLSASSLEFLMADESRQQKALDTNYGLCQHYKDMLAYFKKSEAVKIDNLRCDKRGSIFKIYVEATNQNGKKYTHTVNMGNSVYGESQIDNIETVDRDSGNKFRLFFAGVRGRGATLEAKDIQYFVPGGSRPAPSQVYSLEAQPTSEFFKMRHESAVKSYYSMKNYMNEIVDCCSKSAAGSTACEDKFINTTLAPKSDVPPKASVK